MGGSEMTDEQINTSIAKACGISGNTYKLCLKTGNYEQSPNFCNDLNAMHEAEGALFNNNQNLRWKYVSELHIAAGPTGWWNYASAHATARQRAEAFLRTLGKWEETK
jgi:hypothetical protein